MPPDPMRGMRRIVHLGLGNFHRAHQAWYTSHANLLSHEAWRITGVSLRNSATRDALKPQGYAYTLEILDSASAPRYETITVIDQVLVAAENPQAVLEALADPATAIVTLTITEKGYCLRPGNWRLDLDHPGIRADLGQEGLPRTAIGFLAAGLHLRRERGLEPLTVISCDNLPRNSQVLSQALLDYAARKWPELGAWIPAQAAFPCSLVDRIVPASTEALQERVQAATGRRDAWPVSTEAFSQWLIEKAFAAPRPSWELAGVEFVDTVEPFEQRKLRLLNGAHSTLAYTGLLAGKVFVHEAVADPGLLAGAARVMHEAAQTLVAPAKEGAGDYAQLLLQRFSNAALEHRLSQIAMDGSQKLPVRIVAPLKERLERGLPAPGMESALAAWCAWVIREIRAKKELADPAHALFKTALDVAAPDGASQAGALLGLQGIFGDLFQVHPASLARIQAQVAGMLV